LFSLQRNVIENLITRKVKYVCVFWDANYMNIVISFPQGKEWPKPAGHPNLSRKNFKTAYDNVTLSLRQYIFEMYILCVHILV